MNNKSRIRMWAFVAAYALSTIGGTIMIASDETFHLWEWLFSGSLFPVFMVLYHASIIAGCILILSKKSKPKTVKYASLTVALLLIAAWLGNYIIGLIPLISNFGLGSPEVRKALAETLARPGGAAAIFLIFIVLMLFSGSDEREDG